MLLTKEIRNKTVMVLCKNQEITVKNDFRYFHIVIPNLFVSLALGECVQYKGCDSGDSPN